MHLSLHGHIHVHVHVQCTLHLSLLQMPHYGFGPLHWEGLQLWSGRQWAAGQWPEGQRGLSLPGQQLLAEPGQPPRAGWLLGGPRLTHPPCSDRERNLRWRRSFFCISGGPWGGGGADIHVHTCTCMYMYMYMYMIK